jgi:3-deoxy-manno-octulosonate cytidylyltransferase (CMP-KDO synthetase)
MAKAKVIIVIPARYASTRLPGKPLLDIRGKPMIQWVYERAKQVQNAHAVIVATDDERILKAVQAFGGEARMTSSSLASGTDRVAAIAQEVSADVYVNVQGDEPMIDPRSIEKAMDLVVSGRYPMGTVMTPLRSPEELSNPAVVKVVTDLEGRALYFSRFPIPYSRQSAPALGGRFASQRHVGLYVYNRETLLKLTGLPVSSLEVAESLEQLRALENGIPIGVAEVESLSIGVDTPEELEKVRQVLV